MPLAAVIGTAVAGGGYVGVIGTPPLLLIPARPLVFGLAVAIVGDVVELTNGQTTILAPITTGSLRVFVGVAPMAMTGSAVGPATISAPVSPSIVV